MFFIDNLYVLHTRQCLSKDEAVIVLVRLLSAACNYL